MAIQPTPQKLKPYIQNLYSLGGKLGVAGLTRHDVCNKICGKAGRKEEREEIGLSGVDRSRVGTTGKIRSGKTRIGTSPAHPSGRKRPGMRKVMVQRMSRASGKKMRKMIGKRTRRMIGAQVRRMTGAKIRRMTGKIARRMIGKRTRRVIGAQVRRKTGAKTRRRTGKIGKRMIGKRLRGMTGAKIRRMTGKIARRMIGKRLKRMIGAQVRRMTGTKIDPMLGSRRTLGEIKANGKTTRSLQHKKFQLPPGIPRKVSRPPTLRPPGPVRGMYKQGLHLVGKQCAMASNNCHLQMYLYTIWKMRYFHCCKWTTS